MARLAAVREAVGREVCIRIDANQAWNAKQAVRILNQMQDKGLDIEFVEQPVPAADLRMQYVTRHADVPVLADESVFSPADALKIMQTGAADLVNIKLMKCGGITNALRIAAAAEVYGVECMIGCMLEAKISVNAAVELACAKRSSPGSTSTARCCAAKTTSSAVPSLTKRTSPSRMRPASASRASSPARCSISAEL